jgi:two-component system sensor histidine kinase KdpD
MERRSAESYLREIGESPRLLVYLAAAPGAGKTRRLLEDARRMRDAGKRVLIGSLETKERPNLDELAAGFPRAAEFAEMLEAKPDVVLLDELAFDNPDGSTHAKRWQDALALREAGISVICALNVAHLDTVAPVAEAAIGHPIREIVPLAFLKKADEVIALDASPQLLRQRLLSGKVVGPHDIERALEGAFKESTLLILRQLLLRTIDELTIPAVSAERTSAAAAILPADLTEPEAFLRRTEAIAAALDLDLDCIELTAASEVDSLHASLVALPKGDLAGKLVNRPVTRDIFIIAREQTYLADPALALHPLGATVRDRMRTGYGKLTIYLGAAAGAGKTFAMLDRAKQLRSDGVDVVAGYIETHGRAETDAMIGDLEVLPRKRISSGGIEYQELDRDALIARHPAVALIDELAHTNAPGSVSSKRFHDVLAVLRSGINVIATLNVQHLEALGDAVFRLTGTTVRETLPDGILSLADEVILIDVTPELLRERLRAGKIYRPEKVDAALANFFTAENLRALRELAVRELLRAESRQTPTAPFDRLLLSVAAREEDLPLIRRCSKIAARLHASFAVAHVGKPGGKPDGPIVAEMEAQTRASGGTWLRATGDDIVKTLLATARVVPETTIAVGGTLRTPHWPQPNAFARRLLDAGGRELFVLARRVQRDVEVEDVHSRFA